VPPTPTVQGKKYILYFKYQKIKGR